MWLVKIPAFSPRRRLAHPFSIFLPRCWQFSSPHLPSLASAPARAVGDQHQPVPSVRPDPRPCTGLGWRWLKGATRRWASAEGKGELQAPGRRVCSGRRLRASPCPGIAFRRAASAAVPTLPLRSQQRLQESPVPSGSRRAPSPIPAHPSPPSRGSRWPPCLTAPASPRVSAPRFRQHPRRLAGALCWINHASPGQQFVMVLNMSQPGEASRAKQLHSVSPRAERHGLNGKTPPCR